jgi:RNA polymerase sigma-70 factor (ECF subfamily)
MDASDALAVQEAQAGNHDAFRSLVERHSHSLFRLAYRMTGNEQDAEEVVQETFLRAYRRIGQFESRANFGTWIYRIGVNCALDLLRNRQRHAANVLDPPLPEDSSPVELLDGFSAAGPSPEQAAWSAQIGAQVRQALAALSANERAAFVMRHCEGLSIEEIAAALGLRTSATKNSIFRAVQKLRRALQPLAGTLR